MIGIKDNARGKDWIGNGALSEYADKAEILKALGHPVRLCMVKNLLCRRCNVRHMEECLALPQSTISQHLSVLRSKGIVKREKDGVEAYYEIASELVKDLVRTLFPEKGGEGGD